MKPILPSMTPRLIASVAFLAAAPMLLTASRPASLGLEKSTPADGSTVDAVPEIRLWFTEAPMNMGPRSVSIRILGADGKAITTGNAARDAKDAKVYSLALPEGLEPPPPRSIAGWSTATSISRPSWLVRRRDMRTPRWKR